MALDITKKDILLGQSVETALGNADDNFTTLFDAVDTIEEEMPTKLSELENDIGVITGSNGTAPNADKLDNQDGSYYLNYNNFVNTPTSLKNPTALTFGSKTYDGSVAREITKADIGLGNVTNEKQYSASNQPPYPVTSVAGKTGAVTLVKGDVGLGNLTNDAQVKRSEMGVASGVATLGTDGKVPQSQLPSYVDDVVEYSSKGAFPTTGESGKIYVAMDTNKTWRWSGTTYVEISASLALGETSSTAFAGDRGKALEDRTINGKRLGSANITLTQDDVASGSTYKRVKSGGDITIGDDGTVTVNAIGGNPSDEIGKVKGVTVNGTNVVNASGIAVIELDPITSEYTSVTANASKAINGTTYYGFNIVKTDVAFEVYNSSNQQIITQRVIDGNNIFVACSTTSGGTFTIRKASGGGTGGVTTDMLNAIAVYIDPVTKSGQTTSVRFTTETTLAPDNKYAVNDSIDAIINAPPYYIFTNVAVTNTTSAGGSGIVGHANISADGKTITIGVAGGSDKPFTGEIGGLATVTYTITRKLSF